MHGRHLVSRLVDQAVASGAEHRFGRLLAAEILGGQRDEMLADFRPERCPL
ncbi:hypothetical protein ACH4CC_03460 [Streptomyces lydicus]|uniref:hypothetical protein n=1 Tax=Streptomyces lydicus TaxID=47763 RepID=UPI0037B3AA81